MARCKIQAAPETIMMAIHSAEVESRFLCQGTIQTPATAPGEVMDPQRTELIETLDWGSSLPNDGPGEEGAVR